MRPLASQHGNQRIARHLVCTLSFDVRDDLGIVGDDDNRSVRRKPANFGTDDVISGDGDASSSPPSFPIPIEESC